MSVGANDLLVWPQPLPHTTLHPHPSCPFSAQLSLTPSTPERRRTPTTMQQLPSPPSCRGLRGTHSTTSITPQRLLGSTRQQLTPQRRRVVSTAAHEESSARAAAPSQAQHHQQYHAGHPTSSPLGSSSSSTPALQDVDATAWRVLTQGNGLARRVLSDPRLEGDPLGFLKQTEAFWRALKQQQHEPHKPGPTVVTTTTTSVAAALAASSSSAASHDHHVPLSFGAAPRPVAIADGAGGRGAGAAALAAGQTRRQQTPQPAGPALDFDVVMCGGTLGICVALALQLRGFQVAVVERRRVEGRLQEWNSSRHEVQVLVDMGLLTQAELEAAIASEFNPIRVGFKGSEGPALSVRDVLNIGVAPKTLIASLRSRFEVLGGVVYEGTAFRSAVVAPDGVLVRLGSGAQQAPDVADANRPNAVQPQQQGAEAMHSPFGCVPGAGSGGGSSSQQAVGSSSSRQAPKQLTCRLLLDCMGHYSPIVKQLRGKAKPDGMVLVVGGCATGFAPEANTSADLLYSFTDATADMQLFWEAFPAEGGAARTTYMFAYSDAEQSRPSFERLLDTYFTLLPTYQGLPSLQAVQFKRVLFGGFPCFSSTTPLQPGFDRVLQLGDASASASPLSFGGLGSMLRHLRRVTGAISHALHEDRLALRDLAWVHPYQPSLSASWLFQRAMSMQVGQQQQQQALPAGQQQQQDNVQAAAGAAAPGAAVSAGEAAAPATTAAASSSTQPRLPAWLARLGLLPASHINALLGANFAVMAVLGQRVLKPFLQDTLQLGPLAATMAGMMLVKPLVIARVVIQVGPKVLLGWFGHFAALAAYTLAHHMLRPFRRAFARAYSFQRVLDALEYGSGSDHTFAAPTPAAEDTASGGGKGGRGSSGAAAAAPQSQPATTVANNAVAAPANLAAAAVSHQPAAGAEA